MDRVTEYAISVVAGEVVTGELHMLACERHLKDMDRAEDVDFPYYWDVEASENVLRYAETLTVAEGAAPRPVRLIPSQAFDIGCTFGWRLKASGFRRFRRRYKSVARQNGKTFENGILGTYIAGFSGYNFGKLFTAATKKRQAKLAWEEMAKFIRIDPDLDELFSIKDYKNLIVAKETGCTIEALSREGGLDEGFRSIFASIDEIHQHRDNKVYKTIYDGTRDLPETLVSMITTRGERLNSFCREMDDYCIQILRGTAVAEDFFVDIYALDETDNPWDPACWIKANPWLCSKPEGLARVRADAQTAKDMGGADMRDFLTKSLNMWVKATDDAFVNGDKWKRCGSKRKLEAMRGRHCSVGLDLSSGGDLTTLALEFDLDEGRYYEWSHSYMPRGRLEEHLETDLAPYDLWEQMGLITVTGGATDYKNDYKFIVAQLKTLRDEYDLTYDVICYDPHNADGILAELEEFGCPLLMVVQSAKSLNDATADMQLLVKGEKIEYDEENELLTWSVANAVTVRNSFDEIKIDKKPGHRFKRIDPCDAMIDAHFGHVKLKPEQAVDVGAELEKYLEIMGWS